MKAYTAQEWQIKFKEQAGKDKQLQHDLACTALFKRNDVKELLETKHAELVQNNRKSWSEKADRTHHQALLIEDLLADIGYPELKQGRVSLCVDSTGARKQ